MFRKFLILSAFLAVMGGGAWVWAQTSPAAAPAVPTRAELKKAIQAGDHKTLAQYYKAMADKARAEVAMHEEMKADYKQSYVHYKGSEDTMPIHCDLLIDQEKKKAAKYDEMAALEAKLAAPPAAPAAPATK